MDLKRVLIYSLVKQEPGKSNRNLGLLGSVQKDSENFPWAKK